MLSGYAENYHGHSLFKTRLSEGPIQYYFSDVALASQAIGSPRTISRAALNHPTVLLTLALLGMVGNLTLLVSPRSQR